MALAYLTHNFTGGAASSLSTSLTISGSDRLLVAGVIFYRNTNTFVDTGGVTFNGDALTELDDTFINIGNYYVTLYYLTAPDVATANLAVTFGGNQPFDAHLIGIAFTGAHQTVPFGTPTTGTGSSTTPSISVASAANEIVLDVLTIVQTGTLTVGAGQTQRANGTANGFIRRGCSTESGAAPNVTMSWSNTNSADWAMAGVSIKPSTAGSFQPAWARNSNILIKA